MKEKILKKSKEAMSFLVNPKNRGWVYFWGIIFIITFSGAMSIVAENTKITPEKQTLPPLPIQTMETKERGITRWVIPSINVFTIDKMVKTVLVVKDSFDDQYYEENGALVLGEVFQSYLEDLLDRDPLSTEAWGLLGETFPYGVKASDMEWNDYVLSCIVCRDDFPTNQKEFFEKINERWDERLVFEEEYKRLCYIGEEE